MNESADIDVGSTFNIYRFMIEFRSSIERC